MSVWPFPKDWDLLQSDPYIIEVTELGLDEEQ